MSLSNPFLPPNPLYPRASGEAGAEGLKKQFLINNQFINNRPDGAGGGKTACEWINPDEVPPCTDHPRPIEPSRGFFSSDSPSVFPGRWG
jgi:hypothetical protein